MGGISIWQLLITVAIIVLLFGTKKLRTLGEDLGTSIKGFKKAMSEDNNQASTKSLNNAENTAKTETVKEKEQA